MAKAKTKTSVRPRSGSAGRLRIVAGNCGGRFIRFKEADGLRPTGERIRETLFNWLQFDVPGGRVLDMFAGSGALGFEAASRGAAAVTMVELNAATCAQLRRERDELELKQIALHQGSALAFLQNTRFGYDVIFVDPPFHSDLMVRTLEVLASLQPFASDVVVYLEFERSKPPQLPAGWEFERLKESGDVGYGIIRLPEQRG